jgi:hypothetical protein
MGSKSTQNRNKQTHKSGAPAHKGSASARHGAAQASPTVVQKKHGGWLTAAIIIMAVHGVIDTAALLSMRKTEFNAPWVYGAALLVGLVTIVSAIALWYWKLWGLYLYVAATFVSLALGLIIFRTQWAAFYNLVPLLILGWILQTQRKMQYLT